VRFDFFKDIPRHQPRCGPRDPLELRRISTERSQTDAMFRAQLAFPQLGLVRRGLALRRLRVPRARCPLASTLDAPAPVGNRARSLAGKKSVAVVDPAARRSSLGYTDESQGDAR
jgi:hypothetical protein